MNTPTLLDGKELRAAAKADEQDLHELVKDFVEDGGSILVEIGENDLLYVQRMIKESGQNEFYYYPQRLKKKKLVVKISYYDETCYCLRFDLLIRKGLIRRRLVPYIPQYR